MLNYRRVWHWVNPTFPLRPPTPFTDAEALYFGGPLSSFTSAASSIWPSSKNGSRAAEVNSWVLSGHLDKPIPIGSMYAIYGNIYHQYTPNVSIYTIHGSYGIRNTLFYHIIFFWFGDSCGQIDEHEDVDMLPTWLCTPKNGFGQHICALLFCRNIKIFGLSSGDLSVILFISHSVYRNEGNHKKHVWTVFIFIYCIYIYTHVYVYTCSFTSDILQCICFLKFKIFRPTPAGHLLKVQPLLGCCPFFLFLIVHVFFRKYMALKKQHL